ncbi:MAG: DNA sulfur modification protein DndD [Deltaproteobacteria bacterium]|nr:DNA sulfur modification protein DndD [Kofleriaceae bacterium]
MILDELVLHNFGVYRGRQGISLTPPSPQKPVVLFGGLNGGGKTTLLDGLQLALYGRAAHCSNRGQLAYPDFLERCINSRVPKTDGAALEVQFRHRAEGQEHTFRVHRRWHATPSGAVKETLEILRDGKEDPVLAEAWAEHVDEFMPAGISHLFLFDGEKIEGLAEQQSSSRLLASAIGTLLGLDLVDQLSTDLVVLERRKRTDVKSDDERREIDAVQQELDALRERTDGLNQQRASVGNELDMAVKGLAKLEARFKKEGGDVYERRTALEAERAALEAQIHETEEYLCEVAGGVLPLALVGTLVASVVDQDAIEVSAEQQRALTEVLERRDRQLANELKRQHPDAAKWVASFLTRDRSSRLESLNVASYLHLSSDARASLASVAPALAAERRRATELVHKLEKQRAALDRLDRRLAGVPTSEAISHVQEERDQARVRVEAAKARLAGIEAELQRSRRTFDTKKEQLVRLIEKRVKADFASEDAHRLVHHSQRVRTTLTKFRAKLVERHVKRIEQLILESFQQLLRKETLVSSLSIDLETFNVLLRDRDGAPLEADRLSAGERQLLAVSMLWGLARASGRPLPAVIDTPLGRLDSAHRKHLVRRYFPYASHQVLLLSTDEEIDEGYFEELKRHVGRSYLLHYDDRAGSTSVREGYFW